MATSTIRGLNRHYAAIIGCTAAFTAGAVVTLVMRVVSKAITRAPTTWEDYTIFLATALFVVTAGLMMKGVAVGRYSEKLNDPADQYMNLLVYIYSVFYFSIIALCIASILLLYRRVFRKPFVKTATTILLVTTACWWIPCTVIEIYYFSTPPEILPGNPKNTLYQHINYLNWWLAVGILEQVIIVVAIFLPMREIYRLQLVLLKRLAIMFVFAISYTCVGTGIARLASIYHPHQDFDISLGDIWVSSHLGTAIMSANLPVCWPIFLRAKRFLGIGRGDYNQPRDVDKEWERNMAGAQESEDGTNTESHGPLESPHRSRATSVAGSAMEAVMVGPTTKDGHVRNEAIAQQIGADPGLTASDKTLSNQSEEAGKSITVTSLDARENNSRKKSKRSSLIPRWLELRLVDWRMSISGSMFASQQRSRN